MKVVSCLDKPTLVGALMFDFKDVTVVRFTSTGAQVISLGILDKEYRFYKKPVNVFFFREISGQQDQPVTDKYGVGL